MEEEKHEPAFSDLEQAGKYSKERAKEFAKGDKNAQATTCTPPEQRAYLLRGINSMPKGVHKDFLSLRVWGASLEYLQKKLKLPMVKVKILESEAMKHAKDCISKKSGRHSGLVWTPPGT